MSFKLSFFQKALRPMDGEIKSHSHTCHELVYYEHGSGELTLGDKASSFKSGMWALIEPDCAHSEKHKADTTVLFIGFEGIGMNKLPPQGLYADSCGQILPLIRQIIAEAVYQPILHEEKEKLLLAELAIELYRETNKSRTDRSLDYAAAYLRENCNQSISIQALARICGWSQDGFRHAFKAQMGLSPVQYLVEMRLGKAAEMLKSGASCTEAALNCGFYNASQFSTMFKRRYGISPAQYKKVDI